MDIHEISKLDGKIKTSLNYNYNGKQIRIKLDSTYSRGKQYMVYIDYTSKPDELPEQRGSAAIMSHKGLFFINSDGTDKNKPRQIWTQGETEDNSCWFPTIDKPDQRMTSEIYMTVDKGDKTLSNGTLLGSVDNNDGTRTDHWAINLGIPPYLVMMAIGPFAIIHDSWRGKPVDYYIDDKYAPYARAIFGKTPQMIELFSNLLHFPYVWNKYDQVVVHDYVSGAMENATATLHGDFLLKTSRELIDDPLSTSEDIISHELFHHWFGDLVTCQSWSNIPLNESFATYGEYLWREYAWGRDAADQLLQEDGKEYIERNSKEHNLIDFYYADREDDFDLISYQKGGCILHMLRNVVGDSAFFEALHLYLETNKFTAVESNELRLAFEKVTGKDLNWFFNEWFYNKGYPVLNINHSYDKSSNTITVNINQAQDLARNPVFEMPVCIDIYHEGTKERHMVTMDKVKNTYSFPLSVKPDWVDVDAQKMLLCVKNEEMPLEERAFQRIHSPLYLDRWEAMQDISRHLDDMSAKAVMFSALNDKFWSLRHKAIEILSSDSSLPFELKLKEMAKEDKESRVRAKAIGVLSSNYHDKELQTIYRNSISDSSILVETAALKAIAKTNPQEAVKDARSMENTDETELLMGIATVLSKNGDDADTTFFTSIAGKSTGFGQLTFLGVYGKYLERCSNSAVEKGITVITQIADNKDNRYAKYFAKNILRNLDDIYHSRIDSIQSKINEKKTKSPNDDELMELNKKLGDAMKTEKKINDAAGQ
jgi:aminopeptidase N